jgi:hypothetical protein
VRGTDHAVTQVEALAELLDALLAAVDQADLAASFQGVSAASPAVTGGSLLVITLDTRWSPTFPSPSQLHTQVALLAAAAGNTSFSDSEAQSAAAAAALSGLQDALRLAVFVGGVRANVTWASPDGGQVHVRIPWFEQVCGSDAGNSRAGADCGYQAVRLAYERDGSDAPATPLSAAGIPAWASTWLAQAPTWNVSAIGSFLRAAASQGTLPPLATVACPPWCPGMIDDGAAPLAVVDVAPDGMSSALWPPQILPAAALSARTRGELQEPVPLASAASAKLAVGGLYYTAKCSTSLYEDWDSGACSNVSHPRFPRCAFGAGGSCRPCPTVAGQAAAVCPGGFRAIPLPGFYTPSESSGLVSRCAAPSERRCLGWNASASAVQCGAGYRPLSHGCLACDAGYYSSATDATGECLACPAAGSLDPLLLAALTFAGIISGVVALVLGIGFATAKLAGGTLIGGSRRAFDLLVWTVAVFQLLAQVTRTAQGGLPPLLSSVFRVLSGFQFASIATPAACWGGAAFTSQLALLATAVACSVLLWVALACLAFLEGPVRAALGRWSCCAKAGTRSVIGLVLRALFAACSLLYAPVTNTALSMIVCVTVQVPPAAYLSLQHDGDDGAALQSLERDGTISVSVLSSNPSVVCYNRSHTPVAVLAWLAIVALSIAYPLWTAVWARNRVVWLVRDALRSEVAPSRPASASDPWLMLAAADAAWFRELRLRLPCTFWPLVVACGRERLVLRFSASRKSGRSDAARALAPAHVRGIDPGVGAAPEHSRPQRKLLSAVTRSRPREPVQAMGASASRPVAPRSQLGSAPRRGSLQFVPQLAAGAGAFAADACNTCPAVCFDNPLRPFVGNALRASVAYLQQLEMICVGILAALQCLWLQPDAAGVNGLRCSVYVLVLLGLAWLIGTRNPFWPHDAWKLYVKIGTLLLAALAAILAHSVAAFVRDFGQPLDATLPSFAQRDAVRLGLSYAVFAGCVLLLAVLVIGFLWSTVQGGRNERLERVTAAAQGVSFLRTMADATGATLLPYAEAQLQDLLRPDIASTLFKGAAVVHSGGPATDSSFVAANPLLAAEGIGRKGVASGRKDASGATTSIEPQAPASSRQVHRGSITKAVLNSQPMRPRNRLPGAVGSALGVVRGPVTGPISPVGPMVAQNRRRREADDARNDP